MDDVAAAGGRQKIAGVLIALRVIALAHPRFPRWRTAIAVALPLLRTAANTAAGTLA